MLSPFCKCFLFFYISNFGLGEDGGCAGSPPRGMSGTWLRRMGTPNSTLRRPSTLWRPSQLMHFSAHPGGKCPNLSPAASSEPYPLGRLSVLSPPSLSKKINKYSKHMQFVPTRNYFLLFFMLPSFGNTLALDALSLYHFSCVHPFFLFFHLLKKSLI